MWKTGSGGFSSFLKALQLDKFSMWIQEIWLQGWQSYPLSYNSDKFYATELVFMPLLCQNLWFANALSSLKNSLRGVIALTVNSTLFNFPLDRMAIFSFAGNVTVLKVEWVTKWKICELGKSCRIIWGKLRTWGTCSNDFLMSEGRAWKFCKYAWIF